MIEYVIASRIAYIIVFSKTNLYVLILKAYAIDLWNIQIVSIKRPKCKKNAKEVPNNGIDSEANILKTQDNSDTVNITDTQ